jgi:hypothetical protein
MERAMITDSVAADVAEGLEAVHASKEATMKSLTAYLKKLGLKDTHLLETLSVEFMQRARWRVAPDVPHEEVLRLALEEAQRRFDNAIIHTLNFTSKDFQLIAAVRAAILLNGESSDFLFQPEDNQAERIAKIQVALPMATPPEARLGMEEQPISFFFSSSPKAHT